MPCDRFWAVAAKKTHLAVLELELELVVVVVVVRVAGCGLRVW